MPFRLVLAAALAALCLDARAQSDAEPAYTQVALVPADAAPVPPRSALDLPASAAPAVDVVGETIVAAVVAEPAPVEDSVQLRALRAPVRMELAQSRRRVVLLPGVSQRDLAPEPASEARTVGHVTYSRAVVVVGEGGEREVRFLDVAPEIDLGVAVGCDGAALDVALRLRGLRATPLRRGMRGDAVEAAQHLLCAAGQAVEPDGVFDAELDADLRAFQRSYNASGLGPALVVDGALGPKTRKALDVTIAARTAG